MPGSLFPLVKGASLLQLTLQPVHVRCGTGLQQGNALVQLADVPAGCFQILLGLCQLFLRHLPANAASDTVRTT